MRRTLFQLGNVRVQECGSVLKIYISGEPTDALFTNDIFGLRLAKETIEKELMEYV